MTREQYEVAIEWSRGCEVELTLADGYSHFGVISTFNYAPGLAMGKITFSSAPTSKVEREVVFDIASVLSVGRTV